MCDSKWPPALGPAYEKMKDDYLSRGQMLPSNKESFHELDCAVLNYFCELVVRNDKVIVQPLEIAYGGNLK